MSFKVITGRAPIAGSAALRGQVLETAGADLEVKLNAGDIEEVCHISTMKDENEIQIIAVVRVADVAPVAETAPVVVEAAPAESQPELPAENKGGE